MTSFGLGDWRLAAEAAILVWSTAMLLRVLPLRRLRRLSAALARPLSAIHKQRATPPERIAWAVAAAARRSFFGSTCLTNAIAGQALFASYGYPTILRIGAKGAGVAFEAHAWLERDGEVVVGGPRSVAHAYSVFQNVDELTV